MCGIYLTVVEEEEEVVAIGTDGEDYASSAALAAPAPPAWLIRRGPDHQGRATAVAKNLRRRRSRGFDNDGNDAALTAATVSTTTATLQASVLRMRAKLVPQPVDLGSSNSSSSNSSSSSMSTPAASSSSSYLAWNGEVYQTAAPAPAAMEHDKNCSNSSSSSDRGCIVHNEDMNDYAVSDTEYVAERMREALLPLWENDEEEQVGTDQETNAAAAAQKSAVAVAQRIAHQLSRLVNAEFAFCVLAKNDTVYYGRDVWGRRSLLVGTVDDNNNNKEEEDGNDGDGDDEIIRTSSSSKEAAATTKRMRWQLASVATNISTSNLPAAATCWREVEPGIVYAYQWTTGTTVAAVPWQPQTQTTISPPIPPSQSTEICSIQQASERLQQVLTAAVQRRLCCGDSAHKNSSANNSNNNNAVLFSGGLDSVVVAALALQVLPTSSTLTLLNVSFVDEEDNDSNQPTSTAAADTQAALDSLAELRRLFPHHTIRFQHKIVDWRAVAARETHVRRLMHPKVTTMDLNISTALWFAAAEGDDCDSSSSSQTETPAPPPPRVLLTGLGADELLGGYARHRKAWEKGGAAVLRRELDLDCARLWDRNLGRDDRILADTSKEVRLPFLDPAVVALVRQELLLPTGGADDCRLVVDYTLPAGQGDKRVLRLVAERLGLSSAARAVKRAIQFGSRVAHVSDRRRFGSRRQATGEATTTTANSGKSSTALSAATSFG